MLTAALVAGYWQKCQSALINQACRAERNLAKLSNQK
jgi:hypothetical protein